MVERIRPTKPLERVRPTKPAGCGDNQWHDLLGVINTRPDTVLVHIASLSDVLACHEHRTGMTPAQTQALHMPSLRDRGTKFCSVTRLELFAFVGAHGDAHAK